MKDNSRKLKSSSLSGGLAKTPSAYSTNRPVIRVQPDLETLLTLDQGSPKRATKRNIPIPKVRTAAKKDNRFPSTYSLLDQRGIVGQHLL